MREAVDVNVRFRGGNILNGRSSPSLSPTSRPDTRFENDITQREIKACAGIKSDGVRKTRVDGGGVTLN